MDVESLLWRKFMEFAGISGGNDEWYLELE